MLQMEAVMNTHPTETSTGAPAMSIEMVEDCTFERGTRIKVIGVGGGGGNAVEHMIKSGVQGVEFICANTDAQALTRSGADRVIQLGATGLGAGGKPDQGKEAAKRHEAEIREAIEGADMLFITAGMGGGTGTGAAPEIARIAKDAGILTVGVVTKPFDWEGGRRMKNAENGLAELQANVNSLIVVLNEQLLVELGDDITQDEAFAHANDVLKNAVGGISEIINVPGHVNVDFEDVRSVMEEQGKAMLGTATATGANRAAEAAREAVKCPLLEGIQLSGAKGVLVLVSAARGSLKLSESKTAMQAICAYADPQAHVIYGTAYDDSLGEAIRVTVVATGLNQSGRQNLQLVQPEQGRRTGTDDLVIPTLTHAVGQGAPAVGHISGAGITTTAVAAVGVRPGPTGPVEIPQVWKMRTTAAERVNALSASGMDEAEIPAFLRKQAD
jgi:cell division protein FtsZ